jgi:hypothetical protein
MIEEVKRPILMLLTELVGGVAIGNSNVDVYYLIFHLKTCILFHNSPFLYSEQSTNALTDGFGR